MSVQSNKQFISLEDFTKDYADKLPQILTVNESLYGLQSDFTVCRNQQLEVYCKKESPIVTMKISGKSYPVPVHSCYQFSVLYNPLNNLLEAREGYVYETVADLMKASPLPNIVCLGKECKSAKRKLILPKGQRLIIEGIESQSFGKIKKLLKCSIMTDIAGEFTTLYLKKKCQGQFSTKESSLLFPLSTLLKMNKLQWPVNTSIYDSHDMKLHSRLINKSALLFNEQLHTISIITTLITTSLPQCTTDLQELLEIYTTLPLTVSITQLSETQKLELAKKRNLLSQTLSPDMITGVQYDDSPTESKLTKDLLLPTHNEKWLHEIGIMNNSKTNVLYESLPIMEDIKQPLPPPLPLSLPPTPRPPSLPPPLPLSLPPAPRPPSLPPPLPPSLPPLRPPALLPSNSVLPVAVSQLPAQTVSSRSISRPPSKQLVRVQSLPTSSSLGLTPRFKIVESISDDSESDIINTPNPSYGVKLPTDSVTTEHNKDDYSTVVLTNDINVDLIDNCSTTTVATNLTETNSLQSLSKNESFLEENKKALSDYNHKDIGKLLVTMGLEQYAVQFEEEFITGRLLFELDDDILREELGMNKKLHRIRIMMIIKGTECVSQYIPKE